MSREVLTALLNSVESITAKNANSNLYNELLAIKKEYETRQSSSEYKFDISLEAIKKEFKSILNKPLSDLPIDDNIYTILAQQYRDAIIDYIKSFPEFNIENNTLCVNSSNYANIYNVFSNALSSKNSNIRSLRDFIVETILINSDQHNLNERQFLVEKLEPVKQFKISYTEESNTIINAVGAKIYNKLVEIPEVRDIKDLELKLLTLSNRSDFFATICKELKTQESEQIFKGLISSAVSYLRVVSSPNVYGLLQFDVSVDHKDVANLSKSLVNSIFSEYNSSRLERSLTNIITLALEKDAEKLIYDHLNSWINGSKRIPGVPTLYEMPGSPSMKKLVEDTLTENLKNGKAKSKKVLSSAKSKAQKVPIKSNKSSNIKKPSKPNKKQVPFWEPRNTRGQFVGLSNVINLINLLLHDTIKKNMGSPRLNYRTGRFARSAKVLSMTRDRDEYTRVQYTYMLYPYQTFEPGYAQGSKYRDPRVVISESIRELAANYILGKLRVIRV